MGIWHKQDSLRAAREEEQARLREKEMFAQVRAAAMVYAAVSVDISDQQALKMPHLFQTWEQVLADGQEIPKGRVIKKAGQLYRVENRVTPQEHQFPGGEGMLVVYRPIDPEHTGSLEDPIPWVYGMDCHAGKYYRHQDRVYRVAEGGSMLPCVWEPGTAGLWQWIEIKERDKEK